MKERMETLCLRLLDLARAQMTALEAGDIDEALALAGKRQQVTGEIQKIGAKFPVPASLASLAALDGELAAKVRAEMEATRKSLLNIQKTKAFIGSVSAREPGRGYSRVT